MHAFGEKSRLDPVRSHRKKRRRVIDVPFRERELVVADDLVSYLGFSKTRVYQYAREGKLETVTVGGRILFKVKSALRLVGENV